MKYNIPDGATIWARQTIESSIFFDRPAEWFKIWFYLISKANHKDTKLFKRGSNFVTYKEISYYTKANKNQIDRFLRWAKQSTMLTTQKTTRGMIVTICNYDKYQNLSNYGVESFDDIMDE